MSFLIVAAVFLPLNLFAVPLSFKDDPSYEVFTAWKTKYNKKYEAPIEELNRFKAWKDNTEQIMLHNVRYELGLETFNVEINKFADMTTDEINAQRNTFKSTINPVPGNYPPVVTTGLPESVNWTKEGYVTGVKDQGSCGSCWAFSTTGVLEGQHMNATGNLTSLSEQQLVDCDSTSFACIGGEAVNAMQYLVKYGGSVSEADYPYVSGTTGLADFCTEYGKPIAATVKNYTILASGDENSLQEAVATIGPISIGIDASSWKFHFYSSGVYYNARCSSTHLDHAVLAVGYGTTDQNEDYWLVKNSWGVDWGMSGYLMMARNKDNNCGVATEAMYPIV